MISGKSLTSRIAQGLTLRPVMFNNLMIWIGGGQHILSKAADNTELGGHNTKGSCCHP